MNTQRKKKVVKRGQKCVPFEAHKLLGLGLHALDCLVPMTNHFCLFLVFITELLKTFSSYVMYDDFLNDTIYPRLGSRLAKCQFQFADL